jgi:hypothetical protein
MDVSLIFNSKKKLTIFKNNSYFFSRSSLKNEEITRQRMKDAIGTVIVEELYGVQYGEWGWGPHDFHYNRLRGMHGYKMPDDPRVNKINTGYAYGNI